MRSCQAWEGDVRLRSWFSPRSHRTPHDGFRWRIVSNVLCGVWPWPPHALQRDRSTSVPSGLRSPLPTRELRSGGGLLRPLIVSFVLPERQHKHGDFARRRDRRLAEAARNVSPGGARMTPPRTVARASHRHRISKRAPTNPSRQTDAALASTQEKRPHPTSG